MIIRKVFETSYNKQLKITLPKDEFEKGDYVRVIKVQKEEV